MSNEPVKFVETAPVVLQSTEAPAEVPATVVTAPVEVVTATSAPVIAAQIPAHSKLWLDAQQVAKDAKSLGIDVEVLLRGVFQSVI